MTDVTPEGLDALAAAAAYAERFGWEEAPLLRDAVAAVRKMNRGVSLMQRTEPNVMGTHGGAHTERADAARMELAALLAENKRLRKIADAARAWHDARMTAVANCFADLQIGPAYRVQHEGQPTAQEVLADACESLSAALAEPCAPSQEKPQS